MTQKQEKLLENFIRREVRKSLNENENRIETINVIAGILERNSIKDADNLANLIYNTLRTRNLVRR